MKRFTATLILLLLLFPIVSAQYMKKIDMNIDIDNLGNAKIDIFFKFTSKIREIDLPIEGKISEIKSDNGSCILLYQFQQVIVCKPLQPILSDELTLTLSFLAEGLVKSQGNVTLFAFDFPIMWETKEMTTTLRLPLGMALSDKIIIPTSPSYSEIGTDGRRIFIKWQFTSKNPEDIIPIRVYYEPISVQPTKNKFYSLIIIAFSILLSVIVILYLSVIRKKPELVLSVLSEGERIIVEIIQNQQEEEVDQRKIVALSGFSKAKVSRIIQSLEERGVVETQRIGRKNKVKLKKKFVKEGTEQS